MKTLNGYITEDLDELSLDDLEATIIDLHQDSLNKSDWKELMNDYMLARWKKLQDTFEYTPENIKRLDEANELLKASAERVARKAWRIYQAERELMCASNDDTGYSAPFNDLYVEAHLYLPNIMDADKEGRSLLEDDVNEMLWDAIADYYRDDAWDPALQAGSIDDRDKDLKSEDDFVNTVLWGWNYKEDAPENRSWSHDCGMDREATKGICFVWPFKRIVSDWSIPFSDLLKIKGYKEVVTVGYEKIYHEND